MFLFPFDLLGDCLGSIAVIIFRGVRDEILHSYIGTIKQYKDPVIKQPWFNGKYRRSLFFRGKKMVQVTSYKMIQFRPVPLSWASLQLIIRLSNAEIGVSPWFLQQKKSSWWFFTNPSEKYDRQIGSFPEVGIKIKNDWNQQLEVVEGFSVTVFFSKRWRNEHERLWERDDYFMAATPIVWKVLDNAHHLRSFHGAPKSRSGNKEYVQALSSFFFLMVLKQYLCNICDGLIQFFRP